MNVTVNTHPTLVSAAEQFENTVNCVMRPCRYMYTILPLAGIPFPKCTRSLVYRIQKPCIVAEKSQEGLQWEWHHHQQLPGIIRCQSCRSGTVSDHLDMPS